MGYSLRYPCQSNLGGSIPMNEIRSFVEWLSYHPSPDEIARALVLERLAPLGACSSRITLLNADDSLTFAGEYGFDDLKKGKTFTGSEWREWGDGDSHPVLGHKTHHWSKDGKNLNIQLRHRGAIQGHLEICFTHPIEDFGRAEELIFDYAVPISLYLSLNHSGRKVNGKNVDRDDTGSEQLTPRQLSILAGMVEGKTNHELATELGFSVSTIRHETMRIYQALAVSDRKEAAKKALALALL